jgi:cytoskeleton protein RodZ
VSDDEQSASSPGPGGALKAAREALGYRVQDMADALNLTVRVVNDLEAERWQRLPAAAFAKGYVRAYAKLLGLDADRLLDGYRGFGDEPPPPKTTTKRVPAVRGQPGLTELAATRPGTVISGAVVAAVCAVLVVLYLVWPDSGEPRQPELASLPARPSQATTVRPVQEPRPPDAPVQAPAASAPATDSANAISIPPLASDAAPPQPAPVALTARDSDAEAGTGSRGERASPAEAGSDEARLRRISPAGDDRIDLEFTEDCWVEVADAGGRTFSDLARAGDSLVLVGEAPFRIRLGYGPGVSVAFNGQAIALAPHTRRNVASLVLEPPPADE